LEDQPGVRHNYGYFPILVDQSAYGMSRDELYSCLRDYNVLTRKYFYPLVSRAPCYAALPSSQNVPVAEGVAKSVLCLPIYGTLEPGVAEAISELVRLLPASRR
jgi:dTDP-4-amino-4,6-dideoxygalactose transaminase